MDILHLDKVTSDVHVGTTSVRNFYHILDIGIFYLNVLIDGAWSNLLFFGCLIVTFFAWIFIIHMYYWCYYQIKIGPFDSFSLLFWEP